MRSRPRFARLGAGVLAALVFAAAAPACTRKPSGSKKAAPKPPPRLLEGSSGGRASFAAWRCAASIPVEASLRALVDVGEIALARPWQARLPGLDALGAALGKGLPDARFGFFASAEAVALVAPPELRAPSASGPCIVTRSPTTAPTTTPTTAPTTTPTTTPTTAPTTAPTTTPTTAPTTAPTTTPTSPAGEAALRNAAQEVLDRLPSVAIARGALSRSPLSTALFAALARGTDGEAAAAWARARDALAVGFAAYNHGDSIRLAFVFRTAGDDVAKALADGLRRSAALSAPRPPSPTRMERLLSTALRSVTSSAKDGFALVEAVVPADLLVALLSR